MIMNKKIFITGGAGFIASYIIERLVADNELILFDNLVRNAIKYTSILKHKNVRFIEGDVLNAQEVRTALDGADIVIHCAAIAGIYSVVKKPTMTMKVNFLGTHHVLEAAVQSGTVERFIDFSTSEVYGPYVYKGTEESLTSQGPVGEKRWMYSVSKLAAEHFAHAYHEEYGLPVVTVRPFNVYGPRQVGEGAIREIILRALRNEPVILYNDGSQIRAWCYVTDFVDAIIQCLERKEVVGNVLNIGNPQGTMTNYNLAHTIIRIAKSKSKIIHHKHPGPEVEMRVPSIEKAQRILGYEPKVNIYDGIQKSIQWYKKNSDREK
jgi:nucleoside-diphosphate-sugar epimerase